LEKLDEILPEDLSLDIIHEDENLLVINKEA
jgi:23S rRNA-/tRNA-specific pseudouridylate synthase